jgi:serine-protein kinase ATM
VSDIPQFQSWPSELRTELQFLQAHRRMPGTRPLRDLNELSSEVYMNVTKDFSQWISMITILLSDVLAASDPFFAQLSPILQSDVSFAEQVLPVLIYVVLETNLSLELKGKHSARMLLSGYFTSILSSAFATVSCRRALVDTVLHLRNFRPPDAKHPLAHDKWLEVNYTLLARNAIACGAYTTALLFLELAAEYRDSSPSNDSSVEQILFDIYSHIDEPDGFYGIQTNDLRQFLIKRFHHEKQWEKAFRFHGADLEAGNKDATEAEGLLQSFHSFGFDHLAMDTLQNSSFNSSSMSYQLGWRTETWDLPDQTIDQNAGASLYLALRAIHRERDQRGADATIHRAFVEELRRLHGLGTENLTEIRKVTQNLMCLCQLTQWRNSWIQHSLVAKRIDMRGWKDIIHVNGAFECVLLSIREFDLTPGIVFRIWRT